MWGLALALIASARQRLLCAHRRAALAGVALVRRVRRHVLLLLPATAAMGATLPAMERVLARTAAATARRIAALYAGNTFGAVLGVLAAAFWLVPQFGLVRTAGVCAALNLLCAALRAALFAVARRALRVEPGTRAPRGRHVLPLLAATGLLGIGYEVLVVRVLSQVAENTVYTFAMLLAVYLVGTALGAAAYGRWLARSAGHAHGARSVAALRSAPRACSARWCACGCAESATAVLHALGRSMAAALARRSGAGGRRHSYCRRS